ncbi:MULTISPECIES: hypothetical protein [unclassified Bradyrhizobium]|uniref:hypothetical protein n=1 Tax=unclassified Bradyrhizobium TaxID=2631580 RepID=UPI0004154379|nr:MULTISPECIES: hypothetical protein [unclassified Bradyrhizobium]MCP3460420.1 hypothetical protein [Bradyrhizobium sp. CCGUVB23]
MNKRFVELLVDKYACNDAGAPILIRPVSSKLSHWRATEVAWHKSVGLLAKRWLEKQEREQHDRG